MFAGTAGVTREVQRVGIPADEPVELCEDPLHPKACERRAEHDVAREDVARGLIQQADMPPGLGVPNLWMFENPCTSFCDHNTNGGFPYMGEPGRERADL